MSKIELTILMPCLNEEKTVGFCICEAKQFIEKRGITAEILIADNGSLDDSVSISEKLGARVITVPEKGYGNALRGGIEAARGEYVIMGDSDKSYDFSQLEGFLEKLSDGYDMVIGNRFTGGIERGAMKVSHKLGGSFLSWLAHLFCKAPVGDFHCGLRGVKKDSFLKLGCIAPGMEFATEMIMKAAKAKQKIAEMPTFLRCDGRDRAPHLRTYKDGLRHIRYIFTNKDKEGNK